jgi:hypothetical protein
VIVIKLNLHKKLWTQTGINEKYKQMKS